MTIPDLIFAGFLLAAASFSIVLAGSVYVPADFDYLSVDGDRVEVKR